MTTALAMSAYATASGLLAWFTEPAWRPLVDRMFGDTPATETAVTRITVTEAIDLSDLEQIDWPFPEEQEAA